MVHSIFLSRMHIYFVPHSTVTWSHTDTYIWFSAIFTHEKSLQAKGMV